MSKGSPVLSKKSRNSVFSAIFLKPYGNNLLTSGGKAILAIMFVVMFIVAAVEGAAWGYSLGLSYPIFGVIIGFAFFLFMFSLDISLATSDLMEQEHQEKFSEKIINEDKDLASLGLIKKIKEYTNGVFRFLVKGVGSFIIRFLMAGVSLYITSDFITHFLFRSEIEQSLQQQQDSLIQEKIKYLESQKEQIQAVFDEKYQNNARKRDEESKTGVGERTKIFQDELKNLEINRDADVKKIEDRLTKLANAVSKIEKNNDYSGLTDEGISIIGDSQTARNKIILSMESTDAFQKTHFAVEVLIGIFAFGLIFIKLAQPFHLKLYYSSRLQELWTIYKEGFFDQYLPETPYAPT